MGVILVAIAVSLCGASFAAASKPKLMLLSGGGVPSAGVNITEVVFDSPGGVDCPLIYHAQNTVGHSTDTDTLESLYEHEFVGGRIYSPGCNDGYSISAGGFTKLKLAWNGQVKASGNLQLAGPGPCVYDFTKLIATLPVGPATQPAKATGSAMGYLVNKESNLYCPPVDTVPWHAAITEEVAGILVPLETELRG